MERRPIIIVKSAKPLSQKKAVAGIEKFLSQQNQDNIDLSVTNSERVIQLSEEILAKLATVKTFMEQNLNDDNKDSTGHKRARSIDLTNDDDEAVETKKKPKKKSKKSI